jgi:ATP-dependent helicase HrpA
VRDREVEIDYDVEETDAGPVGVARLRLPEKVARSLTEGEIPALDRPVRFVVLRGQRGAVRARTLDELQTQLDQPWTDEEIARFNRNRDEQRNASRDRRRDRVGAEPKRGLRERGRGQRPGRNERQGRKDGSGRGRGKKR